MDTTLAKIDKIAQIALAQRMPVRPVHVLPRHPPVYGGYGHRN